VPSAHPDQLGVNVAPTNQTFYSETSANNVFGGYFYTHILQTDRDYTGADTVRANKCALESRVILDNNDPAFNPIAQIGIGNISIVYSGVNSPSYGTPVAYSGQVYVRQVPTPHSNEYSVMFGVIVAGTYDAPISGGNYWFFDHALHGPSGGPPGRFVGYSLVTNMYSSGGPAYGKAAAICIQTAPGIGPQNVLMKAGASPSGTPATTYPVDIGIHISGYSTGGSLDGFTNGCQLGGYGPVWIDPTLPPPLDSYGGDLGQFARGFVVKKKNAGPSVARLGAYVSEAQGEAGGTIYGLDISDANRASTYAFGNGILGVTGSIRPSAGFGNARVPLWCGSGPGTAIANTTTPSSIFAGVPTGRGSLTIPANTPRIGHRIITGIYGTYGATGTPTVTCQVKLGSTVVLQGTSGALTAFTGGNWAFDFVYQNAIDFQAVGASGKVIGLARVNFSGGGSIVLTAAGTGSVAPSQVSLDTTPALLYDIVFTWSVAATANTMQYLGGPVQLDG
jgi:hypothetical protein